MRDSHPSDPIPRLDKHTLLDGLWMKYVHVVIIEFKVYLTHLAASLPANDLVRSSEKSERNHSETLRNAPLVGADFGLWQIAENDTFPAVRRFDY